MPRDNNGSSSVGSPPPHLVRRGARNRIAKNKPDFVDPFSLRKTRKHKPLPIILSPVSTTPSDNSQGKRQDDDYDGTMAEQEDRPEPKSKPLVVKSVTLRVKLVPFKKRAYLRELWKRKADLVVAVTETSQCAQQQHADATVVRRRARRRSRRAARELSPITSISSTRHSTTTS